MFWDDAAGRYITTVDSDGVRWDRGCTFLNMEAAVYGLAERSRVQRMYQWMEGESTASGAADTFSRYVFAPRVNTIDMGEWWYLNGAGVIPRQPYGTHLENGGAILYTTGFEIMSRAKFLGADNAYQRLSQVLARFWEPDRLCGGPPLYHGENTGWEVGTDLPFPEAGVAGVCAVYASRAGGASDRSSHRPQPPIGVATAPGPERPLPRADNDDHRDTRRGAGGVRRRGATRGAVRSRRR